MTEENSKVMNTESEQMNEESEEDFDFVSQLNPGGLLFHVEYAIEATFYSPTAIGMKGSDGFVLAVEKITTEIEPLLDTTENSNIFTIDQHIGAVVAGLMPDARRVINEAKTKANDYRNTYGSPAPLNHLMQDISAYMHENTLYSNRRPFAASLIFGSYLPDGPKLYCVEPSGDFQDYNGCAIGKAADEAKLEMEEIDFANTSITELVKRAAEIIYMVHDEEVDFELELSWCGEITGGIHVAVPPDVFTEAEDYAKEQIGGPSDSINI